MQNISMQLLNLTEICILNTFLSFWVMPWLTAREMPKEDIFDIVETFHNIQIHDYEQNRFASNLHDH